MIRLTPALLVGSASTFIGFGQDPHHHSCGDARCLAANGRGLMVDRLVRRLCARPGGIKTPWDAALVHHAGYWSHYDHRGDRSSWPIPVRYSARAQALASFARKTNILDHRPEIGDLFVLWSPSRSRFVHAGVVLEIGEPGEFPSGEAFIECAVLSPNVYDDGSVGGPNTLRLTRRICPDRGDWFIRWPELGSNDVEEGPEGPKPGSDEADAVTEAA